MAAEQNIIRENQMPRLEDVGRKSSQKARETMERGKQATEETVREVEQSSSAAFENVRNLNVKLIDMVKANADEACAFARDIASVKAPPDLVEVWMDHATKRIEMVTRQASDLTAFGQKLATESTAPMARGFQQAFTT